MCEILKDFHHHLTSFHYHSGIPVERFLYVYLLQEFLITLYL